MRRTNLFEVRNPAQCRRCGVDIGFAQSKRTGKWYPVDVLVDSSAKVLVASPFGFHKCHPDVIAAFEAQKGAK